MIREIRVEDAASFLQLSKQLDEETNLCYTNQGKENHSRATRKDGPPFYRK